MAVVVVVIVCIAIMALFFAVTVAGGRAHDRQNLEAEMQRLADEQEAKKVEAAPVANDDLWPHAGGNVSSILRQTE